ncbi:MAG TPA: ABC transporter substrate-binding protein [Candidatus Binatia bacterium]|jgi:NitT/TauT family transport system substrate-binding protein
MKTITLNWQWRALSSALACILALALFCAGAATAAERAPAPLEKIRIAYSSISGNQVPAWVAYEKGFFRKNGLDAELIFIEAGSRAVSALLNGDVAMAQMAGPSVIQSRLQGQDVVIVAGFLNTMDYQLMVHNSITRPDQLKGKAMAVSRIGSSSDFATRYALNKYGLLPDKDVTILEIGSQPARFAALESGKIQGAMVTVPLTLKAKKLGFHALADLQMLGLEYQHTALVTSRALIKSKPEVVRNALKSMVEAIHYYKTQRADALAVLGKYLKENSPEALDETYEGIGLALIPEKPYPTLRGIQIMLSELSAKDPKAQKARPEEFVDTSFIKELDASGYIDRLYKSQPVAAAAPAEQARAATPAPAPAKEKPAAVAKAGKAPSPDKTASADKTASKSKAATPDKVVTADKAASADKAAAPDKVPSADKAATTTKGATDPAAEQSAALPQEYTVKAGDTLSKISGQFYGTQQKWQKIFQANNETLKNPDYIFIGQKITIPADETAQKKG